MDWSIFDIIGPIMIGPSSSHTAGAANLGYYANLLVGKQIKSVEINLFGSFAKVYKGHGTDWALLGGLLGMRSDDMRLVNAHKIAQERRVASKYNFDPDEKVKHPNTVCFDIINNKGQNVVIEGCSVGGGSITIEKINGIAVKNINGREDLIVVIGNKFAHIKNTLNQLGYAVSTYTLAQNTKNDFVVRLIGCEDDYEKLSKYLTHDCLVSFLPKFK